MGLEGFDIAVGNGADAEHGNVLLPQQGIKGDVGGDHQLAADIVAVDIGTGVRLGIAQLLRLLQNGREGDGRLMHGVHNEVGGAVHDTAHPADAVQLLAPGQIHQPWDAAAYRSRTQQRFAALPRQRRQLLIVGGDQRLVGGDHMLPGLQGGGDVLIGGMQAAHDLRHHVDGVVVKDLLKITGGDRGNLRFIRADQDTADMEILPAAAPFVDAAAHHAEAQQCNVHIMALLRQLILPYCI